MRAKKGLRKIVVDTATYYWKVTEDSSYFYKKELLVLDESGSCVFMRRYSLDENRIPIITPSVVRKAILEEKEFDQKRAILDLLNNKESLNQWKCVKEIQQPEIILGIGFDLKEDVLICIRQININSYQRTIFDLQSLQVLFEDWVASIPKNKQNSAYLPFGPLTHEIPFFEWSPIARTVENQSGDKLCCYPFYSQYVYFQPSGEDCLQTEHNKGCVRLNKTNIYNKFGFSTSGTYFVVVEKSILMIWKREYCNLPT